MAKLIVLEGLDGSGKGTQTEILAKTLRAEGRSVRVIDFPMYDRDSSHFVRLYLSGGLGEDPADTNAYAASMFFASDRYISYRTDWEKDYRAPDTVVIANRYTTAHAYHQLAKMDRTKWDPFLDWLWDFEYRRLEIPAPDQVLFLDVPQSLSDANVRKRSGETGQSLDIHEKDHAYLAACRNAALYAADKCGWTVIPCASTDGKTQKSREEIAEEIRGRLIPLEKTDRETENL